VSREKEFIKRASERSSYQQKVLKSSGVLGGKRMAFPLFIFQLFSVFSVV
jgi:hypothetical protein